MASTRVTRKTLLMHFTDKPRSVGPWVAREVLKTDTVITIIINCKAVVQIITQSKVIQEDHLKTVQEMGWIDK